MNKKVASKLEDACSDVLKDDLKDAESWISEQQANIAEQIDSTQRAIDATKAALSSAGTFTAAEIDQQVAGITAKKENLAKIMQDYQDLKEKAVKIYKTDKMDEE